MFLLIYLILQMLKTLENRKSKFFYTSVCLVKILISMLNVENSMRIVPLKEKNNVLFFSKFNSTRPFGKYYCLVRLDQRDEEKTSILTFFY